MRNQPDINAAAYVTGKNLCIVGVADTRLGAIPFACTTAIKGEAEVADGPIDVGSELPPEVQAALDEGSKESMLRITRDSFALAAESLVERARQGDQVALATIVLIRKAAVKGSERAKRGLRALEHYARKNKISTTSFGRDTSRLSASLDKHHETSLEYSSAIRAIVPVLAGKDPDCAIVTLANGPELLGEKNETVEKLSQGLSEAARKAFRYGFSNSYHSAKVASVAHRLSEGERESLQLGYCVAMAKRIQAVRLPGTPIKVLSSAASWELD